MHAHDLPTTDDVRAKIAAAQSESLAELGLDPVVVAPWEDGWRTADTADSAFEWWYFDMQLDDGSTLVATFNTKPHTHPDSPLTPSVLLIYHAPDGTRIRLDQPYDAADFTASTTACDVRMGPNTVTGDLTTYTLHVDVGGVVADLTISRGAPSWRPGAGVSWFDSKHDHFLAWVVPVPYGTVTGSITDANGSREVTGAAYHDHNWGNKVMSAFLDHWYWGRAHIGDYTVVYVQMTTKGMFGFGALHIPTFFLAKGDEILTDDMLPLRLETIGEIPGPGDQTYPEELRWSWSTDAGSVSLHATNLELIEALDMREGDTSARRPLFHPHGHPMYYDFNADMTLTVDLAGHDESVTGRTLFEKMMFR